MLTMCHHLPSLPDVDVVEFFAGVATIQRAAAARGLNSVAYDLAFDSRMNLLEPLGFMYAFELLMRCKSNALVHFAPPCSSWVFMSRGSTGRSKLNPGGRLQYQSVRDANTIIFRVAILMLVAIAKGMSYLVEQPGSSLLEWFEVFAKVLGLSLARRIYTWMGAFGAPTPKATLLWSNNVPFLMTLKRNIRRCDFVDQERHQVSKRYQDNNGHARVTGGAGLKRTQAYPEGFGEAVIAGWIATRDSFVGVPKVWEDITQDTTIDWSIARLLVGNAYPTYAGHLAWSTNSYIYIYIYI